MTVEFKPLDRPSEWEWMQKRTHVIACEDSQGIVARDRRGIRAVCVFDSFTVDGCSVHMAIDGPMVIRSGFLSEIANHAFVTCGRKRIFGTVPSVNKKALKLNKHIGFSEVAVVHHGVMQDVHTVVMCMEREECRWITKPMEEVA